MKSNKQIACLAVLALIMPACRHEPNMNGAASSAKLSLTIERNPAPKSSLVADENALKDLNIWVYSPAGKLRESHYFDNLSINGSGSVGFDTSAGGHSRLVLIGNAGRALSAPDEWNTRADYAFSIKGCDGILMVGEGMLTLNATGMESSISLFRQFCRIGLSVELAPSLMAAGASLGGNVRINKARLRNCPDQFSLMPSEASSSMSSFKADASTGLSDGDFLSPSDMEALYSGGTIYMYSLPNYTDVAYSDRPVSGTAYSTYIEMQVDADPMGNVGGGSFLCRFYANDGARIGLQGGSAYICKVLLSNDGAEHYWRKEDYRLEIPGSMYAGTIGTVRLLSGNHEADRISFSLSATPGVESDEVFDIAGKYVQGALCKGVNIIARTAGTGTLYAFDESGTPMGSVPLSAVFPEIGAAVQPLDVTGTEEVVTLSGLSECYADRASDELYEELYCVSDISPLTSAAGLYAEDFICTDISSMHMYVTVLKWMHSTTGHDWREAVGRSFPYRLSLNCGIHADFAVPVVNGVVGRFASDADNGEVVNTSDVPYPRSAVSALDGRTVSITRDGVEMPFGSSWKSEGWASWYGGSAVDAGTSADAYMTVLSDGVRWNFGSAVTQALYGGNIPVFIGKLNPWCGDYVRVCAGTYSSTRYLPVGMEYQFYQIAFSGSGNVNTGNTGMEVYSMLIFREHDDYSKISVNNCKTGNPPGMLGRDQVCLDDKGTAGWMEGTLAARVISYGGDLYERFGQSASIDGLRRDITSSSAFASPDVWIVESEDTHSSKLHYASSAYGGTGTSNIWLYLYCPYESSGVYAADSRGRVSAKGLVPVHLWSVSTRATFEYQQKYDWIVNDTFMPPWQ